MRYNQNVTFAAQDHLDPMNRHLVFLALAILLVGWTLPAAVLQADGDETDPAAAPADTRTPWERLDDPRWRVRTAAFRELAAAGDAGLPQVREHLTAASARVRRACVQLLGLLADGDNDTLERLVARLDDDSRNVATEARQSLLRQFQPGMTARLLAIAEQQRDELGAETAGLDRLIYIFRLREVLSSLAKWRTHRTASGLRFPDQYAGIFDEHPEAVEILLRFVGDSESSPVDVGDDWSLGEALVAAIRALGDNNVVEARPAILALLRRGGMTSGRFYIRRQAIFGAESDLMSIQQVAALTLHRLGTDLYVEDQLRRYEQSLRDYPNSWMAFMMACIYLDIGDRDRAIWALRIGVGSQQNNGFGGFGGADSPTALGHLHLAALIMERATADAEGGAGAGNDAKNGGAPGVRGAVPADAPGAEEPVTVEAAMKHLKLALELGFDDPEWLAIDPRFDPVREREDFRRYLTNLSRIYPPVEDDDESDE